MLDYENQMFLDTFHEDGLLVMSRGLGVNRLFTEFIKVYCDPASLVLVLNTTPSDEAFFTEQLEKQGITHTPKLITSDINAGERIIESCQEAFILRLYRQKNKTGFVKAFTDNPESFTRGFCHIERMMKNLFVKKLFLWPRFHASVVSCFNRHQIDVIEFHQQMTPAMTACQTALLDLINACVNELKRSIPSVDTDEITVENVLTKSFETIIRLQLDPVWHQLSFRSRQLVSDLKTLRLILRHLTQYDSITFYSLVRSIRTSEKAFGQNTGWLFLDAADKLFLHSKERVFGSVKFREKKANNGKKPNVEEDKGDEELDDEDLTPSLEHCPKWTALSEILEEIALEEDAWEETKKEDEELLDSKSVNHILICAEDDRTCSQLKEYLCYGGEELMNRLYQKYTSFKGKHHEPKASSANNKKSEVENVDSHTVTLTQMVKSKDKDGCGNGNTKEKEQPSLSSKDAYFGILTSPMTIIHPLHGCSDPHGLFRTLDEIQPKYVILYDPDMSLVRQLEVFKASRPGKPLRVYFMMYKGSVEEQKYLTTLRTEKEAFEFLIREKATMVITEEQDGKTEEDDLLTEDLSQRPSKRDTRKGGLTETDQKKKVVVDMREFRCELPSLIHRRDIEIEPVTIEVGDYILTPDICVERKSISDLIGSLNNGRLYQQALTMCRFYKQPMLLIEFDANKPFSLQAKSTLHGDVSLQDVTSKLAMLTMHFPKLRLLWCPSPYATAELFEELKIGKPQPSAELAASVTSVGSELPDWSEKFNHGPQDFVLRMSGINSKNFHLILKKFENLYQVAQATVEELTEVLGSSVHANQLHAFLHKEHSLQDQQDTSDRKGVGKGKFATRGKTSLRSRGGLPSRGRGVKRKR